MRSRNSSRSYSIEVSHAPILTAGWVHKRSVSSSAWAKNWRRRFLVLRSDHTITWHADEGGRPLGQLQVKPDITKVQGPTEGSGCRLTVNIGDGDVLLIEAKSAEDKDKWQTALENLILSSNKTKDTGECVPMMTSFDLDETAEGRGTEEVPTVRRVVSMPTINSDGWSLTKQVGATAEMKRIGMLDSENAALRAHIAHLEAQLVEDHHHSTRQHSVAPPSPPPSASPPGPASNSPQAATVSPRTRATSYDALRSLIPSWKKKSPNPHVDPRFDPSNPRSDPRSHLIPLSHTTASARLMAFEAEALTRDAEAIIASHANDFLLAHGEGADFEVSRALRHYSATGPQPALPAVPCLFAARCLVLAICCLLLAARSLLLAVCC